MCKHRAFRICVFLLMCNTASAEAPQVFTGSDIDQAITAAANNGKFVLVDFTASWCPPCKEMDRTTWVDPEVVAWLTEHTTAVQVDVDEDEAASKRFAIRAMPTVIAIVDGKEFERTVGFMDGESLLNWLQGVQRGERRIDRLIAQHGERVDENGQVDTQSRYQLAQQLADSGEHEKATAEYLWLWQHMVEFDPSMVGVRSSFMASDIEELAAVYEPARTAFAKLRDDTEKRLEAKPSWGDLGDWLDLNKMIGDDEKTLEWFDRIKLDPDKLRAAGHFAYKFEDLLVEHARWADLGRILQDPVQSVRQKASWFQISQQRNGNQEPSEYTDGETHYFIESSAQTYAACLAADRDEEAQAIADYLFTVVDPDTARLHLIDMSLQVSQPRQIHLDWLDAVESEPNDLREQVESALKASSE